MLAPYPTPTALLPPPNRHPLYLLLRLPLHILTLSPTFPPFLSSLSCFHPPGFPEHVSHTKQALARRYTVLAIEPLDKRHLCFSSSNRGYFDDDRPKVVSHWASVGCTAGAWLFRQGQACTLARGDWLLCRRAQGRLLG